MRVLWVCNTVFPKIAETLGIQTPFGGGWMYAAYNALKNDKNIQLAVCFPYQYAYTQKIEQTQFYSFTATEESFRKIFEDFRPDIIHIYGTEYYHSYACIKTCRAMGMEDRTVVSIQGLVSLCAVHYYAYLPKCIIHKYTFRDFLRHDNIYWQKKKFEKRGEYEIAAIRMAKHVIGRTDWDYACTKRLHPQVQYHFCNETLRDAFYHNSWNINTCEKYSLFVSQSRYPLKGMHLMLEAMADIVKQYPDAHLYTTGKNPLSLTFIEKIRQTYYNKFLGKLIKKYHLEEKVTFLGFLDEQQMCKRHLKSHVFVSPSVIENSPNSVGEAMILGVPTVSSDVGGVKNLLAHGKDGFIYPSDEPYMLAHYVCKLFGNDDLALDMSKSAHQHALSLYEPQTNCSQLLKIYHKILGEVNE